MPNAGSFAPVYDSTRRGSQSPWYVGIPKRLSPTGAYRREFFANKEDAAKRGKHLSQLDKISQRAAIEAGPQLIKIAVNYDEIFRTIYGLKGGLEEACESYLAHLDHTQSSA